MGPGLAVVGLDEMWVGGVDGGGVAGHVDFEVDLYAALSAKFLDGVEVGYAPDLGGVVGAFLGEEGERGDFEGPGLGVCGVEVEAVEFGEGETFEGSLYFGGGDDVSRDVEVEAPMFERGPVFDG